MRGKTIPYSATEMVWLETNRTMVIDDYHRAFCQAFDRADVDAGHLHALRKRKGWKTGRSGQFAPGQTPANKGKKMPYNANSAATRFQKGQRPHTYRGPGHERIDSKDGYVILIVAETNPWTGAATRPVHKHKWLWEKVHGPVPEGMALKCRDGNKLNTDPSNWELIPRAMLPRLNGRFGRGYDEAPAELKPTIMAVTKLEHRARERGAGR